MKRLEILLTGFLFFSWALSAQDVIVGVSVPRVVAVGEQFRLVFTVNDKVTKFQPPVLNDFNILMGPSQSSSSSIQIINGRMSQNITVTYTYILQASKEGKFTIGSANAIVNSKTYSSNPVEIEVVAGNKPTSATPAESNDRTEKQNVPSGENKNLFVRVEINRSNLYQGEHLVATIKIYSRLSLVGFEKMKFPSFDGFWSQEIYTPTQINLERENINGVAYDVGVLKKTLLYPQRAGEIIIEPFELECIVRQKTSRRRSGSLFDEFFNDPFFDDPFSYQDGKLAVSSPQVKIKVNPLPVDKPSNFTGGVGKFSLEAKADKTELLANEAITFKIIITGKGNLKLIEQPQVHFPPDFEVFDPKVTENIDNSASGASGLKTFEYIIIPRFAGNFRIPPVEFSYFSPENKTYKTLSTHEINITVNKGVDEPQSTVVSGFSKEDLKVLGSDILFIKTHNLELVEAGKGFFSSALFYLVYLVALLLFITIILVRRKIIRERANISLVRNKRANKLARKRLVSAGKYMKENNKAKFFEAVLKGLWGYLSDKLTIPISELSKEKALQALSGYPIKDDQLERVRRIIDNCEYAQYAPENTSSQMDGYYNEAIKVISFLEQNIK